MSKSSPAYVYVLASQSGQHKIGASDSPENRSKFLATRQIGPLKIIATYSRPEDAFFVERTAHKLLADKHVGGEWFDVTEQHAVDAVTQAIVRIDAAEIRRPPPRPSGKNPLLLVRLGSDMRAALERAAKSDDRPVSALGRKILVEWLRQHGWLGAEEAQEKPE